MYDLECAFQLIESNIDKSDFFCEPRKDTLVQKAEQVLELKFPPTYKLFIKKYGCGGINSMEIYGLMDEDFQNSSAPDAIWSTLRKREKGYIPYHFIHIDDTGDGFYYYLDSSQVNKEGEYPVVIWTYGMDENKKEKVAEDFGEFLLQQVQQALIEDDE